jgi:hypothetical protein
MTPGTSFDWAGVLFGSIVAVAGFGAAYWLWPEGMLDRPISTVTFREALKIGGSLALAFVGLAGVGGAIKDANEPFG